MQTKDPPLARAYWPTVLLVLALRDVFTLILWIVVGGMALFAAYLVFEVGGALRKRRES